MFQFKNYSKHSEASCFRRILRKALPVFNKQESQFSNLDRNAFQHPLNRLPKKKKKRKRRKNQPPLNVISNPTVIYCSCHDQSLIGSNLIIRRPCQSLPLTSLRICVGEGRKLHPEPSRTLKSVLRVKETHEIAEAQLRKNEKLREAFGISEYFVEGSSFDPERHAKEAAAKAAIEDTKKYALIPSPPSSEDELVSAEKAAESSSKSKKKKKASASSPSDPSTNSGKKKKKKKHKRKSASISNDEKVSSHKSKPEKEVKKQRHVSPLPTKSKHRKRNAESSEGEMRKSKKSKLEKYTEERWHKSRISRSPSPYASDVDLANNRDSRSKKKKRSSSVKVDEKKKKRSSSKTKGRKHDKICSLTPESSVERSKEVDYRGDLKKHSRNKSKDRRQKYEKEDSNKQHHWKHKLSPVESDRDDYNDFKISDKVSSKIGSKESSRAKKSMSDRKHERRSPSVERRKDEYKSAPQSSSKRKRRNSSSDREYTEKRSRSGKSREKFSADRQASRDKYSKPFYGKKTRLTVSDSESDRSSPSPDRTKVKSKLVQKTNKIDADVDVYKSAGAVKSKNYVASRRHSNSDTSSKEDIRYSRKDRRLQDEKGRKENSKTYKNYFSGDGSKSIISDSDKSRLERVKESPKPDRKSEAITKTTMPIKSNDYRSSKSVSVVQRNGIESFSIAENGTLDADGKVSNRDGSTSSSLSYSPMEKYPHRYKDILSDESRKNQKSDITVRRSESKNRVSPARTNRPKKENELKQFEVKEKASPASSSKTVALGSSEWKSNDQFCLNDVPLPPESSSLSTKLPPKQTSTEDITQTRNKPTKVNDSTSALVKSIPPSLSQKPNTLASSISDVISKSLRKRDSSTSSSDSSPKRRSRSSSSSSSSSDSSQSSGKRSASDSSSSSSRSSSRSSTRRRSRKNSSSDRSSSSSSSDSSRSRARRRNATKSKKKRKKRVRSPSNSDSDSYSSSYSSGRSRSISIPRRKGSPSFLERRRITSARKRPVPYQRSSILRSLSPCSSTISSSSHLSSISKHSRISSPASRLSRISSYLPKKRSPSFRTPSPLNRSPFRWGSPADRL